MFKLNNVVLIVRETISVVKLSGRGDVLEVSLGMYICTTIVYSLWFANFTESQRRHVQVYNSLEIIQV